MAEIGEAIWRTKRLFSTCGMFVCISHAHFLHSARAQSHDHERAI